MGLPGPPEPERGTAVTVSEELTAGETPQIDGSAEADAQAQDLADIGGNVGSLWRSWWTWTPGRGTYDLDIAWGVIGVNSTVVITASELDGFGNRFVGAAPFTVSSIAPRAGAVRFKLNIGWDSPLRFRTDVLVIN